MPAKFPLRSPPHPKPLPEWKGLQNRPARAAPYRGTPTQREKESACRG